MISHPMKVLLKGFAILSKVLSRHCDVFCISPYLDTVRLKKFEELWKNSNPETLFSKVETYGHFCTGSTINGSEPVYQGIIERDISVIRKETEIASLKSELAKIKNELSKAEKTVFTLEDSEKMLRERLADEKHRSLTLEKMASLQKQKNLPKGIIFSDWSIYRTRTIIDRTHSDGPPQFSLKK